MAKSYFGSIEVGKLLQAMSTGHSAFVKVEGGRIFLNLTLWENDAADQYGQTHALQMSPRKDSPDDNKEGRFYLGNFKPTKAKVQVPVTPEDFAALYKDYSKVADQNPAPAVTGTPAPGGDEDFPF
ncbi:MAG: hypothetical protein ABW007_02150 [Chitinophagaceae bacterium]